MTLTRDINPVRLRREELGMLLVELARKIDRSAAFVSVCEGGFVPHAARRQQIAEALETTPERLWPGEYQ